MGAWAKREQPSGKEGGREGKVWFGLRVNTHGITHARRHSSRFVPFSFLFFLLETAVGRLLHVEKTLADSEVFNILQQAHSRPPPRLCAQRALSAVGMLTREHAGPRAQESHGLPTSAAPHRAAWCWMRVACLRDHPISNCCARLSVSSLRHFLHLTKTDHCFPYACSECLVKRPPSLGLSGPCPNHNGLLLPSLAVPWPRCLVPTTAESAHSSAHRLQHSDVAQPSGKCSRMRGFLLVP